MSNYDFKLKWKIEKENNHTFLSNFINCRKIDWWLNYFYFYFSEAEPKEMEECWLIPRNRVLFITLFWVWESNRLIKKGKVYHQNYTDFEILLSTIYWMKINRKQLFSLLCFEHKRILAPLEVNRPTVIKNIQAFRSNWYKFIATVSSWAHKSNTIILIIAIIIDYGISELN